MAFCCSFKCAFILTGGEIILMVLILILNLNFLSKFPENFEFWMTFVVIRSIIIVCLYVEMFGIIRTNYGVAIFSCVFRVLQVIAYVIYCLICFYLMIIGAVADGLFEKIFKNNHKVLCKKTGKIGTKILLYKKSFKFA